MKQGQNWTGAVPTRQLIRIAQGDRDHGLHWSIQNLYILARIFSFDILYFEGKSPLLMRNNQVRFGDTLPETSKGSAFWDMGVNSQLKLLLLFSPYEAGEWGRPQSRAEHLWLKVSIPMCIGAAVAPPGWWSGGALWCGRAVALQWHPLVVERWSPLVWRRGGAAVAPPGW